MDRPRLGGIQAGLRESWDYCCALVVDICHRNAAVRSRQFRRYGDILVKKLQCDFSIVVEREGGWQRRQCTRCKFVTPLIPDLGQRIYCACGRQSGLGDCVGWLLSLVGITQARMAQVGWDCSGGCEERKAILNQVGWKLHDRWNTLGERLAAWWRAV